jgi:hypothetical protein
MEAIDRAGSMDLSQVSQYSREELEDLLVEARAELQDLAQTVPTAPVAVTKTPSGEITGAQRGGALYQLRTFLWPTDKPLYLRPGFILGGAIGIGALASWQKPAIKKAVKKLKK